MKLDRNINGDRMGKYALIKLRNLTKLNEARAENGGRFIRSDTTVALETLANHGILDWGYMPESEFMVIRLKDKYAQGALLAYADSAEADGESEFAAEIREMASRAGPASKFCKKPD